MSEPFDYPRIHKWDELLCNQIADEATELVCDHYGVDEVTDLTEQQIEEIQTFIDNNEEWYSYLMSGFRSVINWWESENDYSS